MTDPLELTPRVFADLLRDLGEPEFRRFVADLWEGEGRETEIEDGMVIVTRETPGETRRVGVKSDERGFLDRVLKREEEPPDFEGLDMVVVGWRDATETRQAAREHGVTVVDADDLYDRLLYAVSRETCRELCRRHFGREVDPAPPTPEETQDTTTLRIGSLRADRRVVGTLGLVVVLTAVVATAALGGGSGGDVLLNGSQVGTEAATPVGGGIPSPSVTPTPTGTPEPTRPTTDLRVVGEPVDRIERCGQSPTRGIELFLSAIQSANASNPESFRAAWNLTDPDARSNYTTFVRNATSPRYRPLRTFEEAEIPDVEGFVGFGPGEILRQTEVTVVANGTETTYWFQVIRQTEPKYRGCWLVSSIVLDNSEPLAAGNATDGSSTLP